MYTHTPTLQARADSTSSQSAASSSFTCTDKTAGDPRCEKPSSGNGLEIGLGVGIPVVIIALIVGAFMLRNYRIGKKEDMEHDPDFDENGDATMLPDLPPMTKEDPFRSRGSLPAFVHHTGYPGMSLPNKSATDLGSVTSPGGADDASHLDAFVLPYQNQMGSKQSLHEFARNSTDLRSYHHKNGSDFSGMPSPSKAGFGAKGFSHSRTGSLARGTGSNGIYSQLANQSTNSFGTEAFYNAKDAAHAATDEVSDTSKSSHSDGFGVQYENEAKLPINAALPSSRKSFGLAAHLHDAAEAEAGSRNAATGGAQNDAATGTKGGKDLMKSGAFSRPAADIESDLESVEDDSADEADADTTGKSLDPVSGHSTSQVHTMPSSLVSSPFDDKHASIPRAADRIDQSALAPGAAREPRISQFDMLQNVSDDEAEEEEAATEKKHMTDEQEEELARMKSVYKVYFDRSNSVASHKDAAPAAFEADESQPLPSLDKDYLKINSELKGDTSYDKRKTTTSSIYEEGTVPRFADGPVIHPHQKFHVPSSEPHLYEQQYAQEHDQGYDEGYDQGYDQGYPQPQPQHPNVPHPQNEQPSPEDFLPLKSLPHASDIRNSSLETFTRYQPSLKIATPSSRSQQGYFENESGSPYMASQASLGPVGSPRTQHSGDLPPVIRENSSSNGATPSASQLARQSVVMLNPVTEITSSRKFKPAGSLPSGMQPQHVNTGYPADELTNGEDLIPGNRKSAVRRMMNSNF